MLKIEGQYEFDHPPSAIYETGTDARFWHHDENGLSIHPKDKRIAEGGEIAIKAQLPGKKIDFSAFVTTCSPGEHVAVEGDVDGYGSTWLTFSLEELDEGPTLVSFEFGGKFHRIPRLGRGVIEKTVEGVLRSPVHAYADQLTNEIDRSISNPSLVAA